MEQVISEAVAMGLNLAELTRVVREMGLSPETIEAYALAYLNKRIECLGNSPPKSFY